MKNTNNQSQHGLSNSLDKICPEWREYVAGGGAAFVSIGFTYPFNKAIYRQQIHNISARDAFRQLRAEGKMHLFRGIASPLVMKLIGQSIMFGSYSQYSRVIHGLFQWDVSVCKLMAATMAGVTEGAFTPLERIQVLMQERSYNTKFRNSFHAFSSLYSYGIMEYYRGLSAILLRNTFGTSTFFLSREYILSYKDALYPVHAKQNISSINVLSDSYARVYNLIFHFLTGAFLGATISSLCFPINAVKANMQCKIGGQFDRFRHVSVNLMKERGLLGMFRGVHVNFSRSFMGWGLVNVTYEQLIQHLRRV